MARFTIMVSIPGNRFYRSYRTIMRSTLEAAEREACQWLLATRLTKYNGTQWTHWAVMNAGTPHSVPRIVSHGNQGGVVFSGYSAGWKD